MYKRKIYKSRMERTDIARNKDKGQRTTNRCSVFFEKAGETERWILVNI